MKTTLVAAVLLASLACGIKAPPRPPLPPRPTAPAPSTAEPVSPPVPPPAGCPACPTPGGEKPAPEAKP